MCHNIFVSCCFVLLLSDYGMFAQTNIATPSKNLMGDMVYISLLSRILEQFDV